MKYLKLKAISSCMGIRRSEIYYLNENNIDISKLSYPLNKIKIDDISFIDNTITFFEEKYSFVNGNVISKRIQNKVFSLDKEEIEYLYFEILPLELSLEAVPYYEDAIKNNYIFDEKAGEFEFILSLIYKNNDKEKHIEYLNLAKNKGFIK